jgi:hypothetical protein
MIAFGMSGAKIYHKRRGIVTGAEKIIRGGGL